MGSNWEYNLMSLILGIIASSKRGFKAFTDLFTRSNGPLGSPWKNIRGTWSISSNTAISSDSASSYPIATIDVSNPTSQTLVADVSSGAGVVFWLSDSGNWWAVYRREQNFSTFVPQTCSQFVPQTCSAPGPSFCTLQCPPGFGQFFFNTDACGETCVPGPTTFFDCSFSFSFDCSFTTSGTNRFLTIIRSISNTVSTIANVTVSNIVSTIRAIISSNSVSIAAFSDTNMTNNIGSGTQAISNPATKSGIILSPSDNQGSSITKFNLS
jgi:hypothetical protein